ncbi:hypothetical protein FRB96_002318 [Tulasnella sp. 330]|nr:hypothetical protein FRB96_002318 [Tulasnella sp. 330]
MNYGRLYGQVTPRRLRKCAYLPAKEVRQAETTHCKSQPASLSMICQSPTRKLVRSACRSQPISGALTKPSFAVPIAMYTMPFVALRTRKWATARAIMASAKYKVTTGTTALFTPTKPDFDSITKNSQQSGWNIYPLVYAYPDDDLSLVKRIMSELSGGCYGDFIGTTVSKPPKYRAYAEHYILNKRVAVKSRNLDLVSCLLQNAKTAVLLTLLTRDVTRSIPPHTATLAGSAKITSLLTVTGLPEALFTENGAGSTAREMAAHIVLNNPLRSQRSSCRRRTGGQGNLAHEAQGFPWWSYGDPGLDPQPKSRSEDKAEIKAFSQVVDTVTAAGVLSMKPKVLDALTTFAEWSEKGLEAFKTETAPTISEDGDERDPFSDIFALPESGLPQNLKPNDADTGLTVALRRVKEKRDSTYHIRQAKGKFRSYELVRESAQDEGAEQKVMEMEQETVFSCTSKYKDVDNANDPGPIVMKKFDGDGGEPLWSFCRSFDDYDGVHYKVKNTIFDDFTIIRTDDMLTIARFTRTKTSFHKIVCRCAERESSQTLDLTDLRVM